MRPLMTFGTRAEFERTSGQLHMMSAEGGILPPRPDISTDKLREFYNVYIGACLET